MYEVFCCPKLSYCKFDFQLSLTTLICLVDLTYVKAKIVKGFNIDHKNNRADLLL